MIKKITSLFKKPKKIVFASYPEKVVDKKYIDAFWEKYLDGTLEKSISKRKDQNFISTYNRRVKIFPLSPTTAVTVRKLSFMEGKMYLDIINLFKSKIKEVSLKHSKLIITDVIDHKLIKDEIYIIERIIPSISIHDFKEYYSNSQNNNNRYLKLFINKFKKHTDIDSFYKKLILAKEELLKEFKKKGIIIDSSNGNIIIIDYNPNTHRFKLGLVDFHGNNSRTF